MTLGIAVTVVHLAAPLTGANALADGTRLALMPLLAVYRLAVTSAPRPRLVRLTLVGLAFSWPGETAPQLVADDASFVVMIGFFLLAQVSYIVAFAPTARRGPLRRHPVLLTGYAAAADFWIMLTYVVGQTLLVVGVTRSCGSVRAVWPPTRRGADRPAAA